MWCLLLLIHLTEVLIFCSKLKEGIGQGIILNKKVRKKGFPLFCSKGQFMSFLFASVSSVGERALYQNSMLSCKMFSEGLVLTLSPKLIRRCKRIQTSIGQTSERLYYVCNVGMVEVIHKFIFTWQCGARVSILWSECHWLGPIGVVTLWEPKSDVVTYMSLFLCPILGLAGSWKRTADKIKTRSGVFLQGCRKLYKCSCFTLSPRYILALTWV